MGVGIIPPAWMEKRQWRIWSKMFPFFFLKDICKSTTTAATVAVEMVRTAKFTVVVTKGPNRSVYPRQIQYTQCDGEFATYTHGFNQHDSDLT